MKLSVFSKYIDSNPFNSMDTKEGEEFIKRRQKSINNWRELIYKHVDENYGDAQVPPEDYFDFKVKSEDK